jgi:hypothetical protein
MRPDFISESVRPTSLAAPVLDSGMGQFQHLQRRLTMVRERSVQRRLSGGGLVAVVLSAIALPLGPRLLLAQDAPPASDRQAPALDDKPAAEAGATVLRVDGGQPAASTSSPNSPRAGPVHAPSTASGTPTPTYERSGMSRIESLDAQLKAARLQIEALQKELADSKAAPALSAYARPVRRDGTVVEVGPYRVVVVGPQAAANPDTPTAYCPAPNVTIRYSNGKLEEVTIPGGKVVWSADVGPLATIAPVQGNRITVRTASGKWYTVGVQDGRILGELPDMPAAVGIAGVVQPAQCQPAERETTTSARAEDRLDAIERKLNKLIEAVDPRAKLEDRRAAQLEWAQRQAEKAASDAKSRRESTPAEPTTPSDDAARQRESAPAQK